MSTFSELNLIAPLMAAISKLGYDRPTPIQVRAIPPLLAGRDMLACAQTGTGKTAAFALPILQLLATEAAASSGIRPIRCLILTPTRELAGQIDQSFADYGSELPIRHAVIYGGVSQAAQVRALRAGVDVLVATPGRLLDLHGQGLVSLGQVRFFVLDEADRMLDMGFVHDVKKIMSKLPSRRHNLLFSATLPNAVCQLASAFLRDPVRVDVAPEAPTAERIEQHLIKVSAAEKPRLLTRLLGGADVNSAIVFTRTKRGANKVVRILEEAGIPAAAIHGNKSQGARTRALEAFRSGANPVLVATDIASRGLDIDGVSHVVNFELPNEPEVYVHRIGRTARAGRSGTAISLCDPSEISHLRAIERLIGKPVPLADAGSFASGSPGARTAPARAPSAPARPAPARAPAPPAPSRPRRRAPRRGPDQLGAVG